MADPPLSDDVLLALWQGTTARIAERRAVEWKIAIALWTAQLVALGFLLDHARTVDTNDWFIGLYLGAGLLLAALHAHYAICFVKHNNDRDRTVAVEYENELRERLEMDWNPSERTGAPAALFQIMMTVGLAVLGPALLWSL